MTNILSKEVERIIRYFTVEAQVHLIIVRIGIVGKWFSFLDAVGEHDVYPLSATLYQSCLFYHLCHQTTTGRTVDSKDVAKIHTVWESAWIGYFHHVGI